MAEEAIMYVRPDGAYWTEKQTIELAYLDGPVPTERIIAIQDGSDMVAPWIFWVAPDRPR
ncbi:hypothetical protein LF41_2450 [Lysobacter dokdonensis DS-58]|uniref:Uncharacterized protein n=1 Tax=Lysobacter dokdonensis DS-58 TaxID=1300345 RepID=A0A0A2WJE9_9GAMM|nr:hypothetical protein [Lysobacter dokdonensis]KGQ19943.1 hypothetical protein LF41_2450 [Lysobacter dokdonensis DS-58]